MLNIFAVIWLVMAAIMFFEECWGNYQEELRALHASRAFSGTPAIAA